MYPDLTKLFGREFVIGYLLPTGVFGLLQVGLLLTLLTRVGQLPADSDVQAYLRNPTGRSAPFNPREGRLIVEPDEPESTLAEAQGTAGAGLTSGKIIGNDVGHVLASGVRATSEFHVGDIVFYKSSAGEAVHIGDKKYRILVPQDVVSYVPTTSLSPVFPPTATQLLSTPSVLAFALVIWLCALLLLALNRPIIRFLEGYAVLVRLPFLTARERREFDSLQSRIDPLKKMLNEGREMTDEQKADLTILLAQRAQAFPGRAHILPTRFGNIIRAFEGYSLSMYGLDAIPGWDRLQLVAPKEARDEVAAEKALLDFWINSWLCSVLLSIESVGFFLWGREPRWLIVTAAGALLTWWCLTMAKTAATQWGNAIKAAIDVSVPILAERLGYRLPADPKSERKLWDHFTDAVLFNRPDNLPPRDLHAAEERPPAGKRDAQ